MSLEDGDDLKIRAIKSSKKGFGKHNSFNIIPSYPARAAFIGSTLSGKSNLAINLLMKKKALRGFYDNIIVVSPNSADDEWEMLEDLKGVNVVISDDWNEEELREIYQQLQEAAEADKDEGHEMDRTLIIFDDMVADRFFLNSALVWELMIRGRHSGVQVWITTQAYRSIPKKWRAQFHHYIIFAPNNNGELRTISEELSCNGMNINQFADVITQATEEPFSFMHINRNNPPNKRYMLKFDGYIQMPKQSKQ